MGGVNHYDADGHKVGTGYRNFWGGTNHYNNDGEKVAESHKNFMGGRTTEHNGSFRHTTGASAGTGCLVWVIGAIAIIALLLL